MNILVTGGTGFTGAALVTRLLELGHTVRSLDYQDGICADELRDKGAELIKGSITDKALVDRCTEGTEFVFHVAAAFREIDQPDQFYLDVNVQGTRNVYEAAERHKVKKVVYCSTQGVHGHISNPPGDENSPIAPEDYYQQTKYEGELVAQEFSKKGMNTTILRPTAIYGPGDPGRYLMIFRKAQKGSFPMFGSGQTFYHPLYIDNFIDAFIATMDLEKGRGETYIIGDEEYLAIKDLVAKVGQALNVPLKIRHYPITPLVIAGHVCEKLCKPLGIAPIIFPRRVDWFRQIRAFKIDKAKKELGYIPKIGIDEGLKRTGEWYKANGYL